MPAIAALSAAALLASLSAPLETPPDAPGEVSFAAGSARWSGETGRYALEDGVVLRRGTVVVRARSATYDPITDEVFAEGDVLLLDDTRALRADRLRAVLNGPLHAEGVAAVLKGAPVDLTPAESWQAARARGANRASVSGDRVDGEPGGRLHVEGARITLCDCGIDRAPSWELRAKKADVDPGKRATLSWPVLYVTPRIVGVQEPVPVLIFPWLYMPLGERQSGVLFPDFGSSGTTGVYLAQPVYVVLGRSADATLTPEYFFGPGDAHRKEGAVSGPGVRGELRWAPAEHAEGEVRLRWLHDLDDEPGGAGGGRFGLEGHHAQDLGPDGRLRLRLALAGDPVLVRDFSTGVLARNAYYTKSDALASSGAGPFALELSAAYLEPLTPGTADVPGRPPGFDFGPLGADVPALHRLPAAAAVLAPVAVGPAVLEGRAGLSRYAAIHGDHGALAPDDPGTAWAAGDEEVAAASARQAVTRAEVRTEVSLPFRPGGVVAVRPWLRGAAMGYSFDGGGDPAATAWGVGGLTLSAELSRRYGEAVHRVTPSIELLAGTGVARWGGGTPYAAYDLWDRVAAGAGGAAPVQRLSAAPPGAYGQLRLGVDSTLSAGRSGRLQAGLTQDLDLSDGQLAESALWLSGARGPFSLSARGALLAFGGRPPADPRPAYRSSLDAFTRLEANAALRDTRGDALTAAVSAVGPGGVGAQAAGVDALFDLRPGPEAASAVSRLGARGVLSGAQLGYEAQLAVRRTDVSCSGKTVSRDAGSVLDQRADLVWDSPCHCFTAGVKLSRDACGDYHYSFQLDLSRLMQGARTP